MRDTFSKSLVQLVKENPKVYLLSGDHGYALFDSLRKEKPDHFINAGVAEQNMVGVAAGLSKVGFYPIIYGLSAFVPIRVLEQIKVDFCYENLPGLFIGDGAGVVYSHLGASHQSTEDISALRGLPNMTILSPCDAYEFKACFDWAVAKKTPVYLRMGKADLGNIHEKHFVMNDLNPICVHKSKSSKRALLATGSMVSVAKKLVLEKNLDADVYSFPVIKPLTADVLKNIFHNYDLLQVIEEHSIYGGLGSAICEVFATIDGPLVQRFGIQDQFSDKCGTYDFLMKEHGLDFESLSKKIN